MLMEVLKLHLYIEKIKLYFFNLKCDEIFSIKSIATLTDVQKYCSKRIVFVIMLIINEIDFNIQYNSFLHCAVIMVWGKVEKKLYQLKLKGLSSI